MKLKITSRDLKFFLLGILAMLLVVLTYDWKDFKAGLMSSHHPTVEQSDK